MKIKILFLLLFSSFSIIGSAQLQKGTWRLGGTVGFVNTEISSSTAFSPKSSTVLSLNPEVALMISDRWMLGAALGLSFSEDFALASQMIHFRHYFKTFSKTSFFWGGEVEWEKLKPIMGLSSLPTRRFFNSRLKLGVNSFLNRNVALEAILDYHYLAIEKINSPNRNNRVDNLGLKFMVKMSLFFDTKLKEENVDEYRNFQKGMWLIGGQIAFENFQGNAFEPQLARFFSARLAIGARFVYQDDFSFRLFLFGLEPFARYYLPIGKKKKLFGEVGIGYNVQVVRNAQEWMIGEQFTKGRLALGLTNMLSQNASFDIAFSYQLDRSSRSTSETIVKYRNIGLLLAFQSYFGR